MITPPFNKIATNSFRNRLEGFMPLSNESDEFQTCRENRVCIRNVGNDDCTESNDGTQPGKPTQRLLHNSVSSN